MRNFTRCMVIHIAWHTNEYVYSPQKAAQKMWLVNLFFTKFTITFVKFTHLGQYKRLHTSVNSTRPVSRQVVYSHWFKPLEQTVSSTAIRAEFTGIRILSDCKIRPVWLRQQHLQLHSLTHKLSEKTYRYGPMAHAGNPAVWPSVHHRRSLP